MPNLTLRAGAAGSLIALLACGGSDNGARTGTSSQAICIGTGCSGSGGGTSGTPGTLGWLSTPSPSAGNDLRLPGTGSVGADGQYHYSIPFDLPQGRQGMAPTLAISYSSAAPDGYLGVGWGLDGLSGIAPCPQTWATNGRAIPVKMDGTDALCLDGQQLLDISNGAGTQFATERDDFARITKVPVSSLDPTLVATDGLGAQNGSATPAFVVQTPGGQTLVYKDYDPVGAPQTHWLLDRATDLDGNSIAYTYWDQSQARMPGLVANVFRSEYPIASITYTGRVHPGSVTAGERTIVFNYDQGYAGRLDSSGRRYGGIASAPCTTSSSGTPSCATVSGAEETITHLLTSIDVYAPAPTSGTATAPAKAYSYEFAFTQSPSTQRMLLASVEKVAGDYDASTGSGGRTLARQFQYNDTSSGLSWNNDWTEVPLGTAGMLPLVDIDNDGLVDMFLPRGGAATALTGATVADGGLTITVNGQATLSIDLPSASFVDLDGDGVPEILAHSSDFDQNPYVVYHRSGGSYASSSLPLLPSGAPLTPNSNTTQIAPLDLDGRGLPSLVALTSAAVEPQSTRTYISGGYLFPNEAGALGAPVTLFAGQTTGPVVNPIVNPTADPTAQMMSGALAGDSPFTGLWPLQYPSLHLGIEFTFPVLQTLFLQDGAGVGAFAGLSASPASGSPVALPVLAGGPASTLWAISSQSVYGALDTPAPLNVLRWTSSGRPLTLVSGAPALGAAANCVFGSYDFAEGGGEAIIGNFDGRSPMEIFQLNPCVHLQGVVSPNLPDGTFADPNDNDPRPQSWGLMQADVDGDGRDDVIALHIFQDENGDGGTYVDAAYLVRWSPAGVLLPAVKMPFVPSAFADFDGDGVPDFYAVTLSGGSAAPTGGGIYLHTHAAHDLLTDVLDEGAPAPLEIVSYTRNWGKTGTAPANGFLQNTPVSSLWPVHDIPTGMQVVAARSIYQGADVGQYDLHEYTYSGPRSDMLGRGFLGFSSVVDFEPARPAETVTTYDNSTIHADNVYLASLPQTVTTTVPTVNIAQGASLALVRQTVVTYQNAVVPTRASANTYVTQVAGWTSTEVVTPAAINWSAQILPCHFTIGSATPMRYRAAAFQYDAYGNLTSDVEATSSSPLSVSGGAVSGTVTGVESITTTTPAPYLTSPTQWLVMRPGHVSNVVWSPSTQSQASVTPRTTDFVYDSSHLALVQTAKINTAAADPTVPRWTTYWRSADGVVTATTVMAYDPVPAGYYASTGAGLSLLGTTPCPWAGGLPCASRTSSVTLETDEGIFPRQITQAYGSPQALTTQVLVNPTFGVPVDSINPNGVATQVLLDDLGRARQTTAGPDPTVYTDYAQRPSANGTQVVGTTVTTHGLGVVTSAVMLDLLGRTVATQTVAFDGNLDCAFAAYDVLGRKTFESRPVESSNVCVPLVNVGTTYQYDPMDRLLSEQLPDGSSYTYYPAFLSDTTVDPMGHVSVVTHDLDDRTTQSTQYLVSGSTSTPLTTSYAYGAFNELTRTTDPKGNANTVTYDAAGRRASHFDPDSGGTSDVYNGFGEVAIESRTGVSCALSGGLDYCVVSLTASAQNPQPGSIVTLTATVSLNIEYSPYYLDIADETGNIVCSSPSLYTCSTTVTSATAASHTYSAYLTYGGEVTDDAAATSTGTVTVQWGTPAGPTPPVAGLLSTSFTHDALGRVTQRYNTEDGTSSFVFDASANGLGLPTSATSPDHVTTTYGYDSSSRPTTTTWTTPTGPDGAMESFTTTTGYDPYGRAALFTYPNVPGSFTTQQNYDPGTFYFVSVTSPTTAINATAPIWAVQSRWPDGQLHTGQLGNGLDENRTYDQAGRLLTVTDTLSGASSAARSLTYVYNADGRASSRTDNVRGRVDGFGYDSLHRITGWGLSWGGYFPGGMSLTYGYDTWGLGNITTVTGSSWEGLNTTTLPTENDSYGSSCPHALTGTTAGAYAWDERGRMISSPTVEGAAYDARDLPRSITTSAGTTTFLYDAYGARVNKTNGSSGTATLTLGGRFERRTIGTAVTDVFYVPGSDGQLAQVEWPVGGSSYVVQYVHADSLGSSSVVSNALGQVESYLDYDPFGKRVTAFGGAEASTGDTGATGTPGDITVGFADLFQDDDLGLVNMNGRMYDPVARHFLSTDPLVSYPLDSQGFNRYSYVMNDPVNTTDPSGDGADVGGSSGDFAGGDGGAVGGSNGSTQPTPPGGKEGPVGTLVLTTPSNGSTDPTSYGLPPAQFSGVTYSAPAASITPDTIPQGCSGGGTWCFGSILAWINAGGNVEALPLGAQKRIAQAIINEQNRGKISLYQAFNRRDIWNGNYKLDPREPAGFDQMFHSPRFYIPWIVATTGMKVFSAGVLAWGDREFGGLLSGLYTVSQGQIPWNQLSGWLMPGIGSGLPGMGVGPGGSDYLKQVWDSLPNIQSVHDSFMMQLQARLIAQYPEMEDYLPPEVIESTIISQIPPPSTSRPNATLNESLTWRYNFGTANDNEFGFERFIWSTPEGPETTDDFWPK